MCALSRPARKRHRERLLPASVGQARGVSLQPVAGVPRGTAALSADELSAPIFERALPAEDGGILRRPAPAGSGDDDPDRASGDDGPWTGDRRRGRAGAGRAGVFALPWPRFGRHGTWHSRPARAEADLYHRPTRWLALRHAHGDRAGLHAACRQPAERERRRRGGVLSGFLAGPGRSLAAPSRRPNHAARMRQPATVRRSMTRWLLRLLPVLLLAAAPPLASAQTAVSDQIKRGEYLARAGDCVACHTAPDGPSFAGRRAMPTPFGTLFSSNISPDPDTGIGKWTADDFYRMMHTGRSPDGGLLYPAMPFASYTKVTRSDSDAIFAFLRSVPPVRLANRPHELSFPYNNRSLILGWRTLFFDEGEYRPD